VSFKAYLIAKLDTQARPPYVVDVDVYSASAKHLTVTNSRYLYVDLFSCESVVDFASAKRKVLRTLKLPTSGMWAWVEPLLR
jgi:hypothetical protein